MRARVVSTVRKDAPTWSANDRTFSGSVESEVGLFREALMISNKPSFNPTRPNSWAFVVLLSAFSMGVCWVFMGSGIIFIGFLSTTQLVCCALFGFTFLLSKEIVGPTLHRATFQWGGWLGDRDRGNLVDPQTLPNSSAAQSRSQSGWASDLYLGRL